MFIYRPSNPNDLALVTDFRLATDRQLDRTEPPGPHVLEMANFYREALGNEYKRTTRIALFDHKDRPNETQRAEARERLTYVLRELAVKVALILPTPNERRKANTKQEAAITCQSWLALGMPDSMQGMWGTYHAQGGCEIVPLARIDHRTKDLVKWQQAMKVREALKVAQGSLKIDYLKLASIKPSIIMRSLLADMANKPIAVDIETWEGSDKILAIGISDGNHAVSVPWDRFTPHGAVEPEPGIGDYEAYGKQCAVQLLDRLACNSTPKFLHNAMFDLSRLRQRGIIVGGPFHDTFAAHAIAFPELRHGLQSATAHMLPCPAWKSEWHPKGLKGYDRDDPEFWTCDPNGLRTYNCKDAYYTMKLARAIMPCVDKQEAFSVPPSNSLLAAG